MFYCDVQWDNSNWHHFVAYSDSYEWDSNICQTECRWLISKEGQLFVYDQEFRNWDLIPFQDQAMVYPKIFAYSSTQIKVAYRTCLAESQFKKPNRATNNILPFQDI